MRTTITYAGVALVCQFDYYAGFQGTLESPPEPEQAEIEAIFHKGEDIASIFTEDQMHEIETLILEATASDREEASAERGRMEREYP